MPTPPTPTQQLGRISPLYTLYFLYLEPLLALNGAFMLLSTPQTYIQSTTPSTALSPHPVTITPPIRLLLTNMASLYILIAILLGGVLRLTKERNVWLGILAAVLISDLGHVYAIYEAAPGRLGSWTKDEWASTGVLLAGTGLRALFLLGVGRE